MNYIDRYSIDFDLEKPDIDNVIDKINEIVDYINEQEKPVEEDEARYTPAWELMYKSLQREYNQLCKENKDLKLESRESTSAHKDMYNKYIISELALNNACSDLSKLAVKTMSYKDFISNPKSWDKLKADYIGDAEVYLKDVGAIDD